MSIKVISKIKPKNNGQFPVVEDADIEGGLRIVDTLTDRDNIPTLSRKAGMLVKVNETGLTYTLSGGVTNVDWITDPIVPGVSPQDLASGINQDTIKLVAEELGVQVNFEAPREIEVDGNFIYVAQSTQNNPTSGVGTIWKIEVNGSTIISAQSINLAGFFPTSNIQVRDIAQDTSYIYATLWDKSNVVIIDKATFTIAGWAYTGANSNAVSVAADNADNFYVTSAGSVKKIYKFTTSAHLGQAPYNAVPATASALNGSNLRWVDYGAGKLWITKGNNSNPGNSFYKVDAATMVLDSALLTVGTNDYAISVLYAFNYVWVGCGNGEIYKLDPTTLSVMVGYPLTLPNAPSVTGLGVGPDAAGNANSRVWVGTVNDPYINAINPNTDTFDYASDIYPELTGSVEGIASIGNYVYVPNYDSTNIGFYNALTAEKGIIKSAKTYDWKQKYTRSLGDVVDGYNRLAIASLNGMPITKSIPNVNDSLVAKSYYLTYVSDLAYDSINNIIWIADSNAAAITSYDVTNNTFKRTSFKDTNVNNITELNNSVAGIFAPIGAFAATSTVIENGNFVFYGSYNRIYKNIMVVDKTSGAAISVANSPAKEIIKSLMIADGYLYSHGERSITKYSLAKLTSNTQKYISPESSLQIKNVSYNGRVSRMAYDGYHVFSTTCGAGSNEDTITVIDPATMLPVSTWVHPINSTINNLLYAFGYLWAACDQSIYKIDVSNPLSLSATAVTGLTPGGAIWQSLTSDGTYIWAGDIGLSSGDIALINPATAAYVGAVTGNAGDYFYSAIYNGVNKMWMATGNTTPNNGGLVQFYTTTHEVGTPAGRISSYKEIGFAANAFTAAGDLSGTSSSQTVIGIQGKPVLNTAPSLNDVLTFNGTQWGPAAAAGGSFTAGGDLSGTSSSQTVIGIRGNPVTSSSPLNGYMMFYNGGSAQFQFSGPGGDLSGNYPSPTVAKVNGVAVTGTPQDGYMLTATGATTATWQMKGATIAVANFAALAGIVDAGLPNGTVAYVNSVKDYFMLDHASSKSTDSITTSATNSAVGRWLRLNIPHPDWQSQTTWYIDSSTGNDENTGAVGSKLKTHAELFRRVGNEYVPSANITINITSTTIDDIDVPYRPYNTYVYYVGTKTSVISDSVNSVTVRNAASNQPLLVTATAGGTFWSTYAAAPYLVTMTSGAASGSSFWVQANLGTGQGRMTSCVQTQIVPFPTLTENNVIANTDTFTVYSLTTVPTIRVSAIKSYSGQTQPYIFQNFNFTSSVNIHTNVAFMDCYFTNNLFINIESGIHTSNVSSILLNTAHTNGTSLINGGSTIIQAGKIPWVDNNKYLEVLTGTYFERLTAYTGSSTRLQDSWSWDWSNYAVFIHPNANVRIGGNFWGTSTTGSSYAVRIYPNATLTYNSSTYLKMAGAVGYDFAFGDTLTSSCRAFDDSIGSFTAQRTLTWTNLTTAVASGGFGDNVSDPITGATVAKG